MNWVLAIFRFQHQYSQLSCIRAVQWTNSGSRNPSALHARDPEKLVENLPSSGSTSAGWHLHCILTQLGFARKEKGGKSLIMRLLGFCFSSWSILCVSSTEPAKTASVVEFGISGFGKIDNPQFFLLSHNTVLWLLLLKTYHWGHHHHVRQFFYGNIDDVEEISQKRIVHRNGFLG